MPAEHRRVTDVTQGGKQSDKRRQETATGCTVHWTGESGGLWETHGLEKLRDTEGPWTDEPHASVTDFILASLVSAELLTSS